MRRVFRCEHGEVFSVESDAVEMSEVWIASFLFSDREKIDNPICLVHPQGLRNVTLPSGDRILEVSGLEIIEVEIAPIVTLREPNDRVGTWKESPIRTVCSSFEIGRDLFVDDISDGAFDGVSHSKSCALVIA